MSEIFAEYKVLIVFLHVISAVVWVGGMVAMRFAAHQSFLEIESPFKRLERITHALKRLFCIVAPFTLVLLITAIFMVKGYGLSSSEYAQYAYVKEGIWTVMFINLAVMIMRRKKAQKALDNSDMMIAKKQLEFIGKYQVPANIILGVIAIFIGAFFSSIF